MIPCWYCTFFGQVLEIAWLYQVRNFKDGITFFSLDIGIDLYKNEHNPKAGIRLMLLNCIIFEISLYQAQED